MSKKHAYWQVIWASILALTLAGVGMGFYLTRHPEGPEPGVQEEKEIALGWPINGRAPLYNRSS